MLCVGVLITLPGFIEQDSQYKRTYLVLFNTSAVTFSKSHFRVFLSLLKQRYSTKCPFCVHASTGGVGGCSHYVFDTCALTVFSHPQMNTAKLQTPAVTLLQISHNSLKIFTSCKDYTAAPFPSSAVPSVHPTSCHSHYSCSPNLPLNVERGNGGCEKKSADEI